ncbi:hypothetical protein PV10_03345 [Exophiala mesophila]|uniref:Uncharacterized protein n=1 Tax=Exophiala mesophila TaxID=212818 RepID=A0A0D1Y4X7_EXOME|nr:uncharacterized protein PV10_03345 [Exophiala mesophila]KIV95726.1 hypothetical protein PV10_03345 [Exophiala mesophila]
MQLTTLFTALAAGVTLASGKVLTVIDPCPQVTTSHRLSTITAQHQVISTCAPTTACFFRKCSTIYPPVPTTWVSTTIPCDYDGNKHSSTLVTKITQPVTCSASSSSLTKVTSVPVTVNNKVFTKTITLEMTARKEWSAKYENLGPLAMPGYPGSGLCKDCTAKDGSIIQVFNVKECRSNAKSTECILYDETRVLPAPATVITQAACPVRTSVPSAGTYTFKFPQTVPARTVTIREQVVTYTKTVWNAYVTRVCNGPTNFDFTTTVTKTLFVRPPPATSAVTTSAAPKGWEDWVAPQPTSTPASTKKTTSSTRRPALATTTTSNSHSRSIIETFSTSTASSLIGPVQPGTTTTISSSRSIIETFSTSTASSLIGPVQPGTTTTISSSRSIIETFSTSTASSSVAPVEPGTTTTLSTYTTQPSSTTTSSFSLTGLPEPPTTSHTRSFTFSTDSSRSVLPLPAQTCVQPSLSAPNSAQVTAALNQWVSDITTVNSFLERVLAQPPPVLHEHEIEDIAREIYTTAFDEPCQLFTLVSAIENAGRTSEASQCAFDDLANSPVPVFPTFVLGSLADVIRDPSRLFIGAEIINHRRCCNVLRDVDVLFQATSETYPGLLLTAPRPSTCQAVDCSNLRDPPAATCSALPFTPINPTSTTSSPPTLPTTTTTSPPHFDPTTTTTSPPHFDPTTTTTSPPHFDPTTTTTSPPYFDPTTTTSPYVEPLVTSTSSTMTP